MTGGINRTREGVLVVVTALPTLLTAGLLFAGGERGRAFIEAQLVATTLFTLGSLGVAVALASLPLRSRRRPARIMLVLPTAVFALLAAVAWVGAGAHQAAMFAMADLFFAAILYRVPGDLFSSRTVLLAQFLPLLGATGTVALGMVLVLVHGHLAMRGAYRRDEAPLGHDTLRGAWMLSTVKDVFFRGHYVLLSMLGLATDTYAVVLRYVDLASRPTDYLFQRLVDEDAIRGRLQQVAAWAPLLSLAAGGAWYFVDAAPDWRWQDSLVVGLAAGLVVAVKYLSFNLNAQLRHARLAMIYVGSLILAIPALLLTGFPLFPAPFLLAAFGAALVLLLRFGPAARTAANSSPEASGVR